MHNFLEAEKTLPLLDVLCDMCEKNKDCTSCKAAKSESTLQEMAEDDVIKSALQLEYMSGEGNTLVQRFTIEYPTYLPLAEVYTDTNCNAKMAQAASRSLRRKLIKEQKVIEFTNKLADAIMKGHIVEVDEEVIKFLSKYPKSYQLINFVIKDSSASQKLRMTLNCSIARLGGSLNENCLKGSSLMNNALYLLF